MKTAADILANKNHSMISITADSTVYDALQKMTKIKIGAILVTESADGPIVGIWTERDLMRNTLSDGFDPRTARIGDYMTTKLHAAPDTASIFELKDMLVGLFIRHILVEKNGQYVGILSVGDIIRASLLAQDKHIQELKEQTSWHYYENWRWDRK